MSAFLKSTLGIMVLSVAMFAGLGQSNEAQARPWGGYYGGGYGGYYGARYAAPYRYNSYRPNYGGYGYGGYNNYYNGGYNSYYRGGNGGYYGSRNYIGVGGVRVGW